MKRIVFAGADEVAEIAYITLQETKLELVAVTDVEKTGSNFFGTNISPLSDVMVMAYDCIVVTAYVKKDLVYQELINNGVSKKDI